MRSIIYFLGVFIIGSPFLSAQTIWGDYFYLNQNFPKAIEIYTNQLNDLTLEQQRFLAKAWLAGGKKSEAAKAYAPVANSNEARVEDYYQYANLLDQEKALAIEYREKAYRLPWKTPTLIENDSLLFKARFQTSSPYAITAVKGNSPGNEFGVVFLDNDSISNVLYLSDQKKLKGQAKILRRIKTDLPIYNFYRGTFNRSTFELKREEELPMAVNSFFQEGPGSYDDTTDQFFFSRSTNRFDKKKTVQLNLYQLSRSDFFSDKLAIPLPFNQNGSSSLHPAITPNGKRLYFASDRPGGYGGMDLYYVNRSNGKYSEPINLGPDINSPADEVFPFVVNDQYLFFSSNRENGLGKLDIYMAEHRIEKRWEVFVLGQSLNSDADDFSFGLSNDLKMGYFSSNRTGGRGADDLYGFEFTPELAGIADEYTYIPTDTLVVASQGVMVNDRQALNDKDPLQRLIKKEAMLVVPPKSGRLVFNSNGTFLYKNERPMATKDSFAYHLKTKKGVSDNIWVTLSRAEVKPEDLSPELADALSPIYYNLDKSDILETYINRVEKVVAIMQDNPTLEIELRSYTDCRGSAAYNMELSTARTQSILKYVRERISNPDRIYGKGYGEDQSNPQGDYQLIAGAFTNTTNIKKRIKQLTELGYTSTTYSVGSIIRIVVAEADELDKLRQIQEQLTAAAIENWVSEHPCIGISEEKHQQNRRTDFKVIRP